MNVVELKNGKTIYFKCETFKSFDNEHTYTLITDEEGVWKWEVKDLLLKTEVVEAYNYLRITKTY